MPLRMATEHRTSERVPAEFSTSSRRQKAAAAADKLRAEVRGRRWALMTEDLVGLLDVLHSVDMPPSVVLVSPHHYLLAKAEFPSAQVGTHPIEVYTCPVELAIVWQPGETPFVRYAALHSTSPSVTHPVPVSPELPAVDARLLLAG